MSLHVFLLPKADKCPNVRWKFCSRYSVGCVSRPINKMVSVLLSLMRYKKGRSALNSGIAQGCHIDVTPTKKLSFPL